jgi:hypothetical protein
MSVSFALGCRAVVMNQDTRIILVALAFLIILFVAVFALTT